MIKFITYTGIIYLLFIGYRLFLSTPPMLNSEERNSHIEKQQTSATIAVVWPEIEKTTENKDIFVDGFYKGIKVEFSLINQKKHEQCLSSTNISLCQAEYYKLIFYEETNKGRKAAIKQAKSIARNKNVVAVLGYYDSSNAVPASVVFEHEGILMISSGATITKLTHYDSNYIFRNITNDQKIALSIIDYIRNQGYLNAYVLYEQTSYGDDFANYFIENAIDNGINVPVVESYSADSPDLLRVISTIRKGRSQPNIPHELALAKTALKQYRIIRSILALLNNPSKNDIKVELQRLQFETPKALCKSRVYIPGLAIQKIVDHLHQDLEYKNSEDCRKELYAYYLNELEFLDDTELITALEEIRKQIHETLASTPSVDKHSSLERDTEISDTLHLQTTSMYKHYFKILDKKLTSIVNNTTDIYFVAGGMPYLYEVILEARKLGLTSPFIGGDPFRGLHNQCNLQKNCGKLSPYYLFHLYESSKLESPLPCEAVKKTREKYAIFEERYEETYKETPGEWAKQGFFAAQILSASAEMSGSVQPRILADTIRYAGEDLHRKYGLSFSCEPIDNIDRDIFTNKVTFEKIPKN